MQVPWKKWWRYSQKWLTPRGIHELWQSPLDILQEPLSVVKFSLFVILSYFDFSKSRLFKKSNFHWGVHTPGNMSNTNTQGCSCLPCWPPCLIPLPSASLAQDGTHCSFVNMLRSFVLSHMLVPFPETFLPTSIPQFNGLFEGCWAQETSHSLNCWRMHVVTIFFLKMRMEPWEATMRAFP